MHSLRMAGSPRKRARRLGIDPLDEPAFGQSVVPPRPSLVGFKPHNKQTLSPGNRERLKDALLAGYSLAAIAKALTIRTPTLKRLIGDDPELQAEVEAQRSFEETELRDILMELARRGDTVAAIFLAKARHGWRDRDDGKLSVEPPKGYGMLLLPSSVPLDEWEAAAYRQQTPYRERPATETATPALRTRTVTSDGLYLERMSRSDLAH